MRERSSRVDDFRSFMDIPNPDEGKQRMRPSVTSYSRSSSFIKVVLPAPLSPTTVNADELRRWRQSRQYWIYNTIFSSVLTLVQTAAVFGWLIYDVLANDLSIGNFILYSGSAITFSGNIQQFLQALGGMREPCQTRGYLSRCRECVPPSRRTAAAAAL